MADNPTFQIPKDVIEPIIQAHVTEAVVRALSGHERILSDAIHWMMNIQVGHDGKPTSYNGKPWITWAISECVRNAAMKAIQSHLEEHGEVIKKQLAAELKNSKSPLVRQLIEAMVGNMTRPENVKYCLTVTVAEK